MPEENTLYLLLGEIRSDVKNVLSKVDNMDGDIADLSSRVDEIEKFRWKLVGGGTLAVFVVSLLVNQFFDLFKGGPSG